jgi:holo-[acyl-carrier protein] synthase
MNIGLDLVAIAEAKNAFQNSVEKVFLPIELEQNNRLESLAGIFAAKEAFFKALGRKVDWLEVWIEKDASGKPVLHSNFLPQGEQAEVSITHAENMAAAVVVIF